MKNIKTQHLVISSVIIILILTYILQSSGHFSSSYNYEVDKTPDNGEVEIQKIVYSPMFGDPIVNEKTNKIFNGDTAGKLTLIGKTEYYNKAFIQIIDKTLIITLLFCLLLFSYRRFQLKNTTHKIG